MISKVFFARLGIVSALFAIISCQKLEQRIPSCSADQACMRATSCFSDHTYIQKNVTPPPCKGVSS